MTALTLKRARTSAELATAREQLRHAGYRQCDSCHGWHNEHMRCEASGSARDSRCPHCGASPVPAED